MVISFVQVKNGVLHKKALRELDVIPSIGDRVCLCNVDYIVESIEWDLESVNLNRCVIGLMDYKIDSSNTELVSFVKYILGLRSISDGVKHQIRLKWLKDYT